MRSTTEVAGLGAGAGLLRFAKQHVASQVGRGAASLGHNLLQRYVSSCGTLSVRQCFVWQATLFSEFAVCLPYYTVNCHSPSCLHSTSEAAGLGTHLSDVL